MNRILCLFAVAAHLSAQVSFDRIRNAAKEPESWVTYSGNYSAHRFSPLSQIVPGNVDRLEVAWIYQIPSQHKVETTPLVADGVMYISEPPSNVTALDLRTGRPLWSYRRRIADDMRVCCGQVNRGVALLGDLVYIGTVDAYLVALDARTGIPRWETKVAEYTTGHSVTVAPLAVKDKIVVGIAGGEYGIRGFLDAYDALTGKLAWRAWTIPGPGEPGNDSWSGESWKTGGAPTWVTGAYDPDLNLVYWGTGNPGPDWNGDVRKGDNLYSDSVLAIDADTGKLKWHFQFTPHDVHDWDANQVPVLMDGEIRGERRKLLITANRNAFYYALDRTSGQFLLAKPYVKQTWASGVDDRGRPIRLPNTAPTVEGTRVWPAARRRHKLVQSFLQSQERLILRRHSGIERHVPHRRGGLPSRRNVLRRDVPDTGQSGELWRHSRLASHDRRQGVGVPPAFLYRRWLALNGGRRGVWGGRGHVLRARRRYREAALAVPNGWSNRE